MYKDMDKILKEYMDKKYLLKKTKAIIQENKEKIEEIKENITNCNLKLEYWANGSDYSERVQTSPKGSSFVEDQIDKGISNLLKEKGETHKFIEEQYKLKRELQSYISNVEIALNALKDKDKNIITLFYIDQMYYKDICEKLGL